MASVIDELMNMGKNWCSYKDMAKTCPSATLSTTNPTQTGGGLNTGFRVNGRLILGTAFFVIAVTNEGQIKVFLC